MMWKTGVALASGVFTLALSIFSPVDAMSLEEAKAKGLVASTAYWAPGIGLVRFRQEVAVGDTNAVMTMKLKTKSLQ